MKRSDVSRAVLATGLGLAVSLAAAEVPDLELNPVTGHVESVDVAPDAGGLVRHVTDAGRVRTSALVSTTAGVSPRIAITSAGDSWVVWWQDAAVDQVYYAVRSQVSGAWSAPAQASGAQQNSRFPEIAHDGTTAWIGYEVTSAGATSVAVVGITDSPEPIPQIVVTTSSTLPLDLEVHAESDHVWVTWVDSLTSMGWSEHDAASGLWSLPQYQLCVAGTVDVTLDAIRTAVLN